MFSFSKRKINHSHKNIREINENLNCMHAKITNEYSAKYGTSFDIIYEKNELVAETVAREMVPQYAMDWLADAIKRGVEIEEIAIYTSIDNKWPYLCATEEETWLLTNEENPLLNSSEGIYKALMQYAIGNIKDENKYNYWLNKAITLANLGNMMLQGLICWRCGDGKIMPTETWQELKNKFQNQIIKKSDEGDAYAQFAVAKYGQNISDDEREKLYLSSIEQGLTDACYYYAKFLDLKRMVSNNFNVKIPQYGTTEWQEYMKVELELYKKGAELDNGVMAGYCQYRLGDMYDNGDGGVFQDKSLAQFWYKKALENGYNTKYLIN